MHIRFFVISLFLLTLWNACTKSDKEHQNVIAEMTGREIVFPEVLNYQIGDKMIDFNPSEADYKIIVYIDSTGCTTCRMKMPVWDNIISEFKTISDNEVNFLMILNTAETPDYIHTINQKDFRHPVCFDPDNLFDKANNLPQKDAYHTFLLDASDRIVAIGNPADNPKIKRLYSEIIKNSNQNNQSHLCSNFSRAIGAVAREEVIKQKFQLKNYSDTLLTIQVLIPSCDCLDISVSSDTLSPNGKITATLLFNPESTESGSFMRYADIYFNEREYPERLYIHGFIVDSTLSE